MLVALLHVKIYFEVHCSTGSPRVKTSVPLLNFCCIVNQANFGRITVSTFNWEERVELAQRYAPRLILFPERKELGKPRIEGAAGDYHPRSLELL